MPVDHGARWRPVRATRRCGRCRGRHASAREHRGAAAGAPRAGVRRHRDARQHLARRRAPADWVAGRRATAARGARGGAAATAPAARCPGRVAPGDRQRGEPAPPQCDRRAAEDDRLERPGLRAPPLARVALGAVHPAAGAGAHGWGARARRRHLRPKLRGGRSPLRRDPVRTSRASARQRHPDSDRDRARAAARGDAHQSRRGGSRPRPRRADRVRQPGGGAATQRRLGARRDRRLAGGADGLVRRVRRGGEELAACGPAVGARGSRAT